MADKKDDPTKAVDTSKELEKATNLAEEDLKKIKDLHEEINTSLRKQLETHKQLAQIQEELNEKTKVYDDALADLEEKRDKALFGEKMMYLGMIKKKKEELENDKEINDLQKEHNKGTAEELKLRKEINKQIEKAAAILPELAPGEVTGDKKSIEDAQKAMEGFAETTEEASKANLDLYQVWDKLQGGMAGGGLIGDAIRSMKGFVKAGQKMVDIIDEAGGGFGGFNLVMSNTMTKAKKSMGTFGTIAVGALVLAITRLANQINNLSIDLGKTTGMGNEFGTTMLNIYDQTLSFGGSAQDAAEAVGALANNFSAFHQDNDAVNKTLGATIVKLGKLGVSADSSTKSMDFFHRGLGMSAEASADMTTEIALMGKAMGRTSAKMIEDFQAVQGRMILFGKDGVRIFGEIAAMAKAAGMEVSTLTDFAKQFDQFDTAADQAAKLNAVLGTQLSTLELLNMTDNERILYIKEHVNFAVGNFESLDKYTKMYIAQAMGLKDAEEAQRLLNMSNAEYMQNQEKMAQAAKDQEELNRRTAELIGVWNRLKIALMNIFMLFEPIVRLFVIILEYIGKAFAGMSAGVEMMSPWMDSLIQFALVLAAAVGILLKLGAATVGIIAAIKTAPVWALVGLVLLLVAAIGHAYDAIVEFMGATNKKSSFSFQELPFMMAEGFLYLAQAILAPVNALRTLGGMIGKVVGFFSFDEETTPGAELGDKFKQFDVKAMAEFDASKFISQVNAAKGAVASINEAIVDNGFVAMTTDGKTTSIIAGSSDIITSMVGGKLTVDVKMPAMQKPELELKVYLEGKQLRNVIKEEIWKEKAGMN